MIDVQKRLRIVKGLIILLALGILGFAGWSIGHKEDSNNITSGNVCGTKAQTASNNNFKLPNDWSWHEVKDIGIKFAYPKKWADPSVQTNSGTQQYVASFTVDSLGTNTTVSLNPDCSDFQSALSSINSDKFDTVDGTVTTKAIRHGQASYSSLTHWSTDAGNRYQLTTSAAVNAEGINVATIDYGVVADSQSCPDDKLASNDQPKCINQSVSDEIDKVISSLQKI